MEIQIFHSNREKSNYEVLTKFKKYLQFFH